MSITIAEILKLPSLRGARVVAGEAGLSQWVSTISVLEYGHIGQFKDVYTDYLGNEIIISAFYNLQDNPEHQCSIINALIKKKVAGLILFYMGVVLSHVDEMLIELANRLDFPIIVMPENRPDLRYGEVIYEVMEAILKSQFIGYDFKNDILEQVSRFPENQRSISLVMRILSDKLHSSIVLANAAGEPVNISLWPRNMTLESFLTGGKVPLDVQHATLNDEEYQLVNCPVRSSGTIPLQAVIYKRGEALATDVVRQVGETLQIAMNLWERQGENPLSELVGAILKDEPYRVCRIAAPFGINVADIRDMWVITPRECELESLFKRMPELISEELTHLCRTAVFDAYDGSIVVMMNMPQDGSCPIEAARSFCTALEQHGLDATLIACRHLTSPDHFRKAYLLCKENLATLREIYPHRTLFSLSEVQFADQCRKIIDSGETAILQYTEILKAIPRDEGVSYEDMLKTLSTYYLDANSSASQAGEMLFLHKNTIKYRIRKFKENAADRMEGLPSVIGLYTALALKRILEGYENCG